MFWSTPPAKTTASLLKSVPEVYARVKSPHFRKKKKLSFLAGKVLPTVRQTIFPAGSGKKKSLAAFPAVVENSRYATQPQPGGFHSEAGRRAGRLTTAGWGLRQNWSLP
jgi:hypothetical protein